MTTQRTGRLLKIAAAMFTMWWPGLCFAEDTGVATPGIPLILLSFNMWGSGANEGLPIDQTLTVLRASNADISSLQESRAEGAQCSAGRHPMTVKSSFVCALEQ